MLTFQCLAIHCVVYFYSGALGLEMLYQWKRCSTALWINRAVHSSFPLCYSPSSRKGSHINADVSLFRWLLFEQRDVKVLGRVCCEAYITVFHSAVSLFLFACQGDVTIGTKCSAWVQPFWGMSSCDLVRMCLLSRGNREGCKPLGWSSCLSTLWMLPIQFQCPQIIWFHSGAQYGRERWAALGLG